MTEKLRIQKTWEQFLNDPPRQGQKATLRLCYLRLDPWCVDYLTGEWKAYSSDTKNRAWFMNRIDLNNCFFQDDETIAKFLQFLKLVGKELEVLQIAQGALYSLKFEEALAGLLRGLRQVSSIRKVIFTQVNLGDASVASSLQHLLERPRCSVKNVALHSCQLNEQGKTALANGIRKHGSGLQSLEFRQCSVTDRQLKQVVDSVLFSKSRATLKSFHMGGVSSLSTASLIQFTRMLRHNRKLQIFRLTDCGKALFFDLDDPEEDETFVDFCEALGAAPHLNELDLSRCHLSQDATIALLQRIGKNQTLQTLKIAQHEPLVTEMAIQKVLQMPSLKSLHLVMADPMSQGTWKAIHDNTRLVSADLGSARLNARMAPLLERNRHMQRAQALSTATVVLPTHKQQHPFAATTTTNNTGLALCVERLKASPHALFLFLTTAALYPYVPPSNGFLGRRRQRQPRSHNRCHRPPLLTLPPAA